MLTTWSHFFELISPSDLRGLAQAKAGATCRAVQACAMLAWTAHACSVCFSLPGASLR